MVNQRVRAMVLRDAWIAGILGFGLVTVILWIDFRNLRYVLLALMPLLVGITLMLGGMVLLGIQMNFINIFVTTMIIGIGVDYGIYILHRYREVRDLPDEEFEQGSARDRQGGGGGGGLHHRRLRLDHLLPLPRPALHRQGGDPGRALHLAGGDHAAAGVAWCWRAGGAAGHLRSSDQRPNRGGHQKRIGITDVPTPALM